MDVGLRRLLGLVESLAGGDGRGTRLPWTSGGAWKGAEINKQCIRLRLPVIVHTDARDWFMEVTE